VDLFDAGGRHVMPDSCSITSVHSFEQTPPETRGLLKVQIKDLGLRLEGSMLEKYIAQLYRELAAKGLKRFHPPCYLSDEWACPDREPIIGIPFYLADPKLAALEQAVNDIEDEREIMMYLRHEAGHAFNYAYELYATREWHELFGPFDRPYADDYKPVPFSRGFVRHIAGWYAQKHPDEDFAETFAVWLTPRLNWRRRYQGWTALAKLEYVERTAKALGDKYPLRSVGKAELPVDEMQATIEDFYRDRVADETPAVADLPLNVDLEDLFVPAAPQGTRPAAEFLAEHRKVIVDKITYWTGVRRTLVKRLVESIEKRAKEMDLAVEKGRESVHLVEVVSYATTLVMNYLTRGRFTEK
jgi:hypothetical protein